MTYDVSPVAMFFSKNLANAYLQQFTPPVVDYKVCYLRLFPPLHPAKVCEAEILENNEGADTADEVEESRYDGVAQYVCNRCA